MNFFVAISYAFGIYFATSVTSFHVKHGVSHGQRINGSMQQEKTDTTIKPVGMIEETRSTDTKPKSDMFLGESVNNEESKNNSLPDLDVKQEENDNINIYEIEDESEENKDSTEDTAVIWITGDHVQKSKITTYESDDQLSGDGLTSDELLEPNPGLQIESNVLHLEMDRDSSKEYINIPGEVDEDLKYVLNGTYDYYMNAELVQNETYKDRFLNKNTKGALSDPEREETTDQSMESTASGANKIEAHNIMIEYGQMENITNTHSSEHHEFLLNNSNVQDLKDSTLMKKFKSVKTNKTKQAEPCSKFHCKRGKTCKTDGDGNPFCACQDPELCQPTNLNDRVCGTDNKTYSSDCYLFATKCQLEGTKEGNHLHLDYQGPCKYIPPCTDYELSHFPFRMRDWLKNVLMQLYEMCPENPGLLSEKQANKVKKIYEDEKRLQEGDHNIELLLKDFQKNYHMYVYPVHWKFNQLDQHSIDRLLTRSELSALRAPLMPMEHCVTAFLQGCNTNNDKHISLQEWCHCFGIKDGDIDENLLF